MNCPCLWGDGHRASELLTLWPSRPVLPCYKKHVASFVNLNPSSTLRTITTPISCQLSMYPLHFESPTSCAVGCSPSLVPCDPQHIACTTLPRTPSCVPRLFSCYFRHYPWHSVSFVTLVSSGCNRQLIWFVFYHRPLSALYYYSFIGVFVCPA